MPEDCQPTWRNMRHNHRWVLLEDMLSLYSHCIDEHIDEVQLLCPGALPAAQSTHITSAVSLA